MSKRFLSIVLALAFISMSFHTATAAPGVPQSMAYVAQASACTDAEFMTTIGKDMTTMGDQFKAVDVKDVPATANLFLQIAGVRQKYEDMNVAPECIDLQLE